ncbi:hypothetical protein T484DRAFT_3585393 [Baffinella frigidus]|nr:hypothetical protein T484DRAFT_3585393 [Cryptophyta sp. CCMP2293]
MPLRMAYRRVQRSIDLWVRLWRNPGGSTGARDPATPSAAGVYRSSADPHPPHSRILPSENKGGGSSPRCETQDLSRLPSRVSPRSQLCEHPPWRKRNVPCLFGARKGGRIHTASKGV